MFDAASVMTALTPVWRGEGRTLLGASNLGPGFLVDGDQRLLGILSQQQVALACSGQQAPQPAAGVICVPSTARLVDVAPQCIGGQPVGVTDEAGRLLGFLDAGHILARIGAAQGVEVRHA